MLSTIKLNGPENSQKVRLFKDLNTVSPQKQVISEHDVKIKIQSQKELIGIENHEEYREVEMYSQKDQNVHLNQGTRDYINILQLLRSKADNEKKLIAVDQKKMKILRKF